MADLLVGARGEHVPGAVDVGGVLGRLDRVRQVDHHVGTPDRVPRCRRIAHVGGGVLEVQMTAQRGADVAGPAGDDDSHPARIPVVWPITRISFRSVPKSYHTP